jgi:hypothetical protein
MRPHVQAATRANPLHSSHRERIAGSALTRAVDHRTGEPAQAGKGPSGHSAPRHNALLRRHKKGDGEQVHACNGHGLHCVSLLLGEREIAGGSTSLPSARGRQTA